MEGHGISWWELRFEGTCYMHGICFDRLTPMLYISVCRVTVDMLSNILWICHLALGTSDDVLIWDGYGACCTRGDLFDFEVGGHDGVYKGRMHVIVPFIGRKNGTLAARQQYYNVVQGW